MKHFSEAIRDGAKKRPQCDEGWSGTTSTGETTTCAAMAGLEDLGFYTMLENGNFKGHLEAGPMVYDSRSGAYEQAAILPKDYKFITDHQEIAPCECPGQKLQNVLGVIVHLNDYHKMSREAISEWVETVERKLGMWDLGKKEEAKTEVVSAHVVTGDCVECVKKD